MNKPPSGGNPSAKGGIYFSERRQNRNGRKHKVKSDASGYPEEELKEEIAPPRQKPEPAKDGSYRAVRTKYGRSRKNRPNKRREDDKGREGRAGNNQKTSGREHSNRDEHSRSTKNQARPKSGKSDNSEIRNASTGSKARQRKNAAREANHSVSSSSSVAGSYGVDLKRKNARRKGTHERVSRRPGRRKPMRDDGIIFPPKPNRSHQGLEPGKGLRAVNGGYQSRHPGSKRPWNQNRESGPLYAALDLGTNNCRLLVAIPQQSGRFRVVDAFSRIVRLGKGMEQSGKLDDQAMDRAVEALFECARKLQNLNIRKTRLIATEACRRAENGARFLSRVKKETGLKLEIVDRETEAYLAAEGCGALVDKKADGAVLFDIGGGSSELILLDRRGRRNRKISEQISSWTSLPIGVVTLSERHGGRDVTQTMFDAMVEDVEQHLHQFEGRNDLEEIWGRGRVHLLGTSGTVTTLAGVHLNLPKYDRRQVDGIWLKSDQVDNTIGQLLAMNFDERASNPCIGAERADLVLAGCAILQAIRNTWPAPRLRVADRGLREGILTQMMNRDGAWINPKKGRRNQNKRSRRRTQ